MSNLDFILLLKEYLNKLEGGNYNQSFEFIKRINTGKDKKYPFNILKMKKVSKNILENTLKITEDTEDYDTIRFIKYALSNYEADKEGLYDMLKIKREYKKLQDKKRDIKAGIEEPEVKPLTDENYEEMITRHKKEGVYRPNLTSEEEAERRDLYKKYIKSKSEKNKDKLLERIDILDNKRAESEKYKQNVFYPEIEKRGDEKRAERARYQRKLLEIQDNEEQKAKAKEEVKPKVKPEVKEEDIDIVSGKLEELLFIQPYDKIKQALIKLNFKDKLPTDKTLLRKQLLQKFNTVDKMKQLINSIQEQDEKKKKGIPDDVKEFLKNSAKDKLTEVKSEVNTN